MGKEFKATLACVLPFMVWMGLMFVLPPNAASYAVRSAATLVAGVVCIFIYRNAAHGTSQAVASPERCGVRWCIIGILAGATVYTLWVALPTWPFPEPVAPDPSPYAPSVCGWPLTVAKLVGSAFIIAPVEEVFFRSFLYRWLIGRNILSIPLNRFDLSAFLWVVLLFSLEHDRPLAAAITGVIYGLLAIHLGLGSAISAHVTTNLLLGLHVIYRNAWQFW